MHEPTKRGEVDALIVRDSMALVRDTVQHFDSLLGSISSLVLLHGPLDETAQQAMRELLADDMGEVIKCAFVLLSVGDFHIGEIDQLQASATEAVDRVYAANGIERSSPSANA